MKIYQFVRKKISKGILIKLAEGVYIEPRHISSIGIKLKHADDKENWVAIAKFDDVYITKAFKTEEEAKNWLQNRFNIEIVEKELENVKME